MFAAAVIALAVAQSPELGSDNGNFNVRLNRQNADLVVTRDVRQTSTVGDINDRLDAIEANMATDADLNAAVLGMQSTAAAAAMNAFVNVIGQQDALRNDVDSEVSTMESTVAGAAATMSVMTSNLQSQATEQMSTMTANAESTMAALNGAILTQVRAINNSLTDSLSEAVEALSPTTVYFQYGRKTCTAPNGMRATRLWAGYLWGSGHNYQGGGNQNLCLQNSGGAHGGTIRNGWDPRDRIIPLRAESGHYACENCVLRQRQGYTVPCAKCVVESQCYLDYGEAGCPNGWGAMYSGYLFGAYRHHHGNNERTCIDKDGPTSDWDNNQNWGGHIYPTMEEANLQARTNKKSVACNYCCKDF